MTEWVRHARVNALKAVSDPAHAAQYACEGTWFVGLDVLENDAVGRVGGSAPLDGVAVEVARSDLGHWPDLHRAQVSVVHPGYPRPRDGETDAGFRYRLNRDAAHVDGVIGLGQPKRRFVQEPHAFILGIPLSEATAEAAPLVVWDGSHHIMRRSFAQALGDCPPDQMSGIDVTDAYIAARREVFDTCTRVVVHAPPGGACLIHRLALHGVAPWGPDANAAPEGRMIAYFRPPMPGGVAAWIAHD
jgi:hypothetical protein